MTQTPNRILPYGRQCIGEDDIEAVAEALRGDYLTTGPKVAEFEKALKIETGAKHAIACSNGTTALHLASIAADIKTGDRVIVPSITFLATANGPRYCGADIVFADVDPDSGLMTAETFKEALTRAGGKAKAVFPVHLAGQCVDLAAIRSIADEQGLKVIADSCHALGSEYSANGTWHKSGSCVLEDMAVFSFHPVKTVAMGEGGAVTTNDDTVAEHIKGLRHHGMRPCPEVGPWFHEMSELGYNYRVPDILCALGTSQLKKLGFFLQKRQELVDIYNKLLKPLAPRIQIPRTEPEGGRKGWHLYAPRFDFDAIGLSRKDFMLKLKEKGILTQVHYIPVHTQPYYRGLYGDADLPGARKYYERTLSLPLFPDMGEDDVSYVVEQIMSLVQR